MANLDELLVSRINALEARLAAMERFEPISEARMQHAENQANMINPMDTLVSHFTDGTTPSGYAWANDAVFGSTPDNLTLNSQNHWLFAYQNTTTKRGFLYRSAVTTTRIGARVQVTTSGSAGLRIDDGTDNNYFELWWAHSSGATADLKWRARTGGGAVTTTTLLAIGVWEALPIALLANYSASWTAVAYIITPTKNLVGVNSLAALTWTPSRAGLLINPAQSAGAGWCDWLSWL